MRGCYLLPSDSAGDAAFELGDDGLTGERALSAHKLRTTFTGLQRCEGVVMHHERNARMVEAGAVFPAKNINEGEGSALPERVH